MVLGNVLGPDIAIVLVVLVLLFGGSQLPKLARSLGSASHEFKKGAEEGGTEPAVAVPVTVPVTGPRA